MNLQNDNIEFKMKFDVPNGYFDSLADNVMANIKYEDNRRKRRKTVVLRALSVAAVLLAFAFIGVVMMPENPRTEDAGLDYEDYMARNFESSYSDYNVMEYLEYDELPFGEPDNDYEESEPADYVCDFYPSPINLYIYQ